MKGSSSKTVVVVRYGVRYLGHTGVFEMYQVDCDRGALVKNTLIGGVESALLDLDMASWQVSSYLTVPYGPTAKPLDRN
jgi:hypothetical protein